MTAKFKVGEQLISCKADNKIIFTVLAIDDITYKITYISALTGLKCVSHWTIYYIDTHCRSYSEYKRINVFNSDIKQLLE